MMWVLVSLPVAVSTSLLTSHAEHDTREQFEVWRCDEKKEWHGEGSLLGRATSTQQVEIYAMQTYVSVRESALAPNVAVDVEYYALGVRVLETDDKDKIHLLHYVPANASSLLGLPYLDGTFAVTTAVMYVTEGIDERNWTSATLLARISGDGLDKLVSKLKTFVDKHKYYQAIAVHDEPTNSAYFVDWVAGVLDEEGASVEPMVAPKTERLNYRVDGDCADDGWAHFLHACAAAWCNETMLEDTAYVIVPEFVGLLQSCYAGAVNVTSKAYCASYWTETTIKHGHLVAPDRVFYSEDTVGASIPDDDDVDLDAKDLWVDWLLTFVLIAAFGLGIRAFVAKTGVCRACAMPVHAHAHASDLYHRLPHPPAGAELVTTSSSSSSSATNNGALPPSNGLPRSRFPSSANDDNAKIDPDHGFV